MSNFTDEYYIKMLSEVGINLFTYCPEVYPQASESIKKVLTLAEKYNIGYYRSLLFNEDGTPTARTGKILATTPMKKFGEISDLIGTLMWLADDNASGFVTGTVIPVDGGSSAYSGV
jgi:NAD(P)-dependent dehydrogenase (short-subunit alcohol dehydrogenase family)